ncbi:YPDG domain-containing protein [Corynebacterium sp. A21]|uniref:YPDG domain-containing protein n=1 Tax=Corynebacterium sp. A21 TaxID=3457318 RepID=UPI003FD0761D
MISKKMLSLLTAAAVSGGAIATAAVVSPTVIAAEQTMAEQYEPYYKDVVGHSRIINSAYLYSATGLPAGTKFLLTDHTDANYGVEKGLYVALSESGDGSLAFTDWSFSNITVPPTGTTITPRITVIYPDGSAEIITAKLTYIPPQNDSYSVEYPAMKIAPGETTITQPLATNLPEDIKISLVNLPELGNLRTAGWTLDMAQDGTLTIAAPEDAEGEVTLPILVTYSDGTSESSSAIVSVEAKPLDAELHDVTYAAATLTGGKSVTITPKETTLPEGTTITLADNAALITAGWTFQVTTAGELTATAPADADGAVQINLTVTYPDGTTEPTGTNITAKAKAVEDPKDEDPNPIEKPIKAGGSSFGSS